MVAGDAVVAAVDAVGAPATLLLLPGAAVTAPVVVIVVVAGAAAVAVNGGTAAVVAAPVVVAITAEEEDAEEEEDEPGANTTPTGLLVVGETAGVACCDAVRGGLAADAVAVLPLGCVAGAAATLVSSLGRFATCSPVSLLPAPVAVVADGTKPERCEKGVPKARKANTRQGKGGVRTVEGDSGNVGKVDP